MSAWGRLCNSTTTFQTTIWAKHISFRRIPISIGVGGKIEGHSVGPLQQAYSSETVVVTWRRTDTWLIPGGINSGASESSVATDGV
ncbi:hypothetical protein BCEP4_700024 [Burkholderia cepacia]|nr:hypothetical protein BCEP4_700024 [Burkholderia cepacia]